MLEASWQKKVYNFFLNSTVNLWLHWHTNTHTRLTALFPGLPGWAVTRKVKPIWMLRKQETVSGSGISWAICKSAPRSRETTTPAPNHSFFTGRMPFLLPNQRNDCTELSSKYRLRVDGSRRGHLLLSSLLIGMLLLLLVHCHWWILVDTAAGSAMHQRHRGRHCVRHHLWHVACRQRS